MTLVKVYKMSEEHKKKISIALTGIKRSVETRKKTGLATKRRMEDPEFRKKFSEAHKGKVLSEEHKQHISEGLTGHKAWNKGMKHSEEAKKKMSESTKRNLPSTAFKKGQFPWNKGKTGIYSEETLDKIRAARAKQIFPKKDTCIEVLMQNELESRNILFKKHKVVFKYHQCDFFIKPNIVVECDGDYWHNLPDVKEKDKKNNQIMKDKNYIVMRFWEKDIKNDIQKRVNEIECLVNRK